MKKIGFYLGMGLVIIGVAFGLPWMFITDAGKIMMEELGGHA